MTFEALWPWGLIGLAAIPLIVLIYLLQGLRQRRVMPSVFLWRTPTLAITARTRWHRPPLGRLFALQLAVAGLAALALARPGLPMSARAYPILVLDASGTMRVRDNAGAADGDNSRFGEARHLAQDVIAQAEPNAQVTVIRAGSTPQIVADTADRAALRQAVQTVQAGAGRSAMREALLLAGSRAAARPETAAQITVISDGVFPAIQDPLARAATRFLVVGRSGDNQSVAGLSTRLGAGGSGVLEGFAQVVNTAPRPVDVDVQAVADFTPLEVRQVHVEPRASTAIAFTLPAQTHSFAIGLNAHDSFPDDDVAEVAVDANAHRNVTLVSDTPDALASVLQALPGVALRVETPRTFDASSADLIVLDAFVPTSLPSGPLIVVRPPADSAVLASEGQVDDVEVSEVDSQSPLLEAVDLGAQRFFGVAAAAPPEWTNVVARSAQMPLVLAGELAGQRVVVLPFDPQRSHLDRGVALPLLMANAVRWALRADPASRGDPRLAADITPIDHPELRLDPSPARGPGAPNEVWSWLALAALGVSGLEWWYFGYRG